MPKTRNTRPSLNAPSVHVTIAADGRNKRVEAHCKAERAGVLWGAAERLREDIHTAAPPSYQADYEIHIARAREELGAERFAEAWKRGRALPFDQTMAYALERG